MNETRISEMKREEEIMREQELDRELGVQRAEALGAGKHTSGPWSIEASPEYITRIVDDHGDNVCHMSSSDVNELPNARLIAAAPELLAALKALAGSFAGTDLDRLERLEPRMNAALIGAGRAIAKAEGRA